MRQGIGIIMNKKTQLFLAVFFVILLLDQLTKIWIDQNMVLGQGWEIIPGYFDLVHYRNPGAAFGMFAHWTSPWREVFFFAVSGLALIFLIYYFVKTPASQKGVLFALSLISAGAFGNLVDRIFRGNVVDFLLLHWQDKVVHFSLFEKSYTMALVWPAFNVADAAISVGVFLLIIATFRSNKI